MSTDNIVRLVDAAAGNGLPVLVINDGDPTETAKALRDLIAGHGVFLSNGYCPIKVVVDGDNLPRAVEVSTEMVRVHASEICRPVKIKKDKAVPAAISEDIARLYLNGLEGQWGLRAFKGIATSPILKNDGSIRVANGYDQESGLWCHNVPNLNIPARPTEEDARAALRRIRHFFRTFPFADGVRTLDEALGVEVTALGEPMGLDESTFLAALLTAVVRQSIELAPAFICDAPNLSGAGTGKGKLVRAICVVGSGASPAAFTSGHDAQEFDKRLGSALIEARPAVFLDNFNGKELRSDILASALTESPAMIRVMGQTKTVPLHTRTFVGITGNSIAIAEDMARRGLVSHLDAGMEDPEQRKFAPGFLESVAENRARLLSDALTIWRWGRQVVLKPGRPIGSYELWAQWCRDPLLMLDCRDPIDRLDEIKEADPKRRELIAFFDVWEAAHGDAVIKSSDIATEVKEHIDTKSSRSADGVLKYNRQAVTRFLQQHDRARVGGFVFKVIKDENRTRPILYYKLERTPKAAMADDNQEEAA
jgi:hypothetical protein